MSLHVLNGGRSLSRSRGLPAADEFEEILIDLIFVRSAHSVRKTRVDFQRRTFDNLG